MIEFIIFITIFSVVFARFINFYNNHLRMIEYVSDLNTQAISKLSSVLGSDHRTYVMYSDRVGEYIRDNWEALDKDYPSYITVCFDLTKWTKKDFYPETFKIKEFTL